MDSRWLVAGFLLVAIGCKGMSGQARSGARSATVTVVTAPLQRISIQRSVDLAGNLISPDQARVSAEAAGVVRTVFVRLGQEVQQGQELVRLEPRELELALQRAESVLKQTEAQLGMTGEESQPPPDDQIASVRTALANRADAQAQNSRAELLAQRQLISGADLEAARTRLKLAEAAYESAIESVRALRASLEDHRAAYAFAQKKLNDAVIRAPIFGAVSERLVQPGEFIKEDTPVITLVQMDPLTLSTGVQEKYAGTLRIGMVVQFTVESFPTETFRGQIVSMSPAVDQATRTFAIEAELPNHDHRLKPGFFAKGIIFSRVDDNVIAAPEEAVSTLAGVSTVFVVENGKVRPQSVTLGVRQGKLIEIVDGLKGNETLAASNLSQLEAGVAVATSSASERTASPGGRGGGRAQ